MDELKRMIKEELEQATEPEKIVEVLQNIGVILLNKYIIEIDEIMIEPVLVEAYYFNADKFRDCNTYGACDLECRAMQSNRFNQLFIHPKRYSPGIDIVLSQGDYCLSYLVKNSLIHYKTESEFCSQEKLDLKLRELLKEHYTDIENKKDVLKDKSRYNLKKTNYEGLFAKRKGTTKGEYTSIETACVLLDRINCYDYSFEKGYHKTKLLYNYIRDHVDNGSNIDKVKIKTLCKGLISEKTIEELLG